MTRPDTRTLPGNRLIRVDFTGRELLIHCRVLQLSASSTSKFFSSASLFLPALLCQTFLAFLSAPTSTSKLFVAGLHLYQTCFHRRSVKRIKVAQNLVLGCHQTFLAPRLTITIRGFALSTLITSISSKCSIFPNLS